MHPQLVAALRSQLRARDPGERRVGWKIALGIGEVEERIGGEPVIGNLTTATQLSSGEATLIVNGEVRAGARAVVDVDTRLRAVARWLEAVGERLLDRDLVFAGSVVRVPVAPGDVVEAAIEGWGGSRRS